MKQVIMPQAQLRRGAIAAIIALLVAACGRSAPPEASQTPTPEATEAPELVYRNINLTETDNDGRVLWKLEADVAEYEQDGFEAALQAVRGELFNPEGQAVTVNATSGRVLPREKRLELSGDVEAEAEPLDIALSADLIEWLPEESRLAAIGNVTVRQVERQIEMTGDRLDADLSTNQMRLSLVPPETAATADATETPAKPAAIRVTAVDPPLDLQTQVLEWDTVGEVVNGSGGVQIDHREQKLKFLSETFTYQIANQTATLVGKVRATASNQAQLDADRVEWEVSRAIAVATGNVHYRQPGEQNLSVRGQKGTADLRANTIALEGSQVTTQFTLP
ncbi:MAG: LPS export ABC transporter periplasmic protein LptC [Cyanobacteria bacterium J06642_2]